MSEPAIAKTSFDQTPFPPPYVWRSMTKKQRARVCEAYTKMTEEAVTVMKLIVGSIPHKK